MYERFYGFKERPFSLLPDPDFLFLGEKHQTALDLLELTIFNQAGFCVVSGEIGAGKTTLIRELLNRLDDDISVGLISNTHPSFGELLQWITAAFDLGSDSADQFELHKRFLDFVIQQYADNKRTLLIIDEAQNLSISAMEELRMLSNVNSDRDLVLQIILVGQNQLRDKLQQPELEQFAQRISVDYHLTGLDEKETRDYIRCRVTRAGGSADIFSDDACRTVYRCSDGIPRLINGICDLCLVYGYSNNSPLITPELVREVVKDQRSGHIRTPPGQLSKQGDDIAMTAFASTLADGASLIEQTRTVPPKHEAESAKADRLDSQLPERQEKGASIEERAREDTEHPAEADVNEVASESAPETIVGSMEKLLLKETVNAATTRQAQHRVGQSNAERLSSRHRPVVEVDQSTGSVDRRGRPDVFPLFVGLVLLISAGALGWLAWDKDTVTETVSADSAEPAKLPVISPLKQGKTTKPAEQREAERLERERQAAEKRLAEQREAERLERERQAAENRLAKQREVERLERERQQAERRLAELREAQRLERERQAAKQRLAERRAAERLKRERQEAEQRLAEQRQAEELAAKRAAALEAWEKTNSGIGWTEEFDDDESP
jgi:type II secretory pathway predicted ATPase ExeA